MNKRNRASGRTPDPSSPARLSPQPSGQAALIHNFMASADRHRTQGDLAAAGRIYQDILRIDPSHAPALFGLSHAAAESGQLDLAAQLARKAVQQQPQNKLFRAGLAQILYLHGDLESAQKEARKALHHDPEFAPAHHVLAEIHEQHGDYPAAIEHVIGARKKNQNDLNLVSYHAKLLRLSKRYEDAESILQGFLERTDVPPAQRSGLIHEAAMIQDALGHTDRAFELFTRYGELMLEAPHTRRQDRSYRMEFIRMCHDLFVPGAFDHLPHESIAQSTPTPAFLVGFPRSGTTMLENVLDAHPAVTAASEPEYISHVYRELDRLTGGHITLKQQIEQLDEGTIHSLRNFYWKRAQQDFAENILRSGSVFLHKMPLLLHDLGFLSVLFPGAKVIVALRDPRDCCLSCFMQDFKIAGGMIHFLTLADTCHLYRDTFDLYLKQRKHLPLDILEVHYESTVRDLEAEARRVLEFLDLEWNPQVLSYHEIARGKYIHTPSGSGVREPVYTKSVARWMRYAEHLEPHLDLLAPFIRAFGYESVEHSSGSPEADKR